MNTTLVPVPHAQSRGQERAVQEALFRRCKRTQKAIAGQSNQGQAVVAAVSGVHQAPALPLPAPAAETVVLPGSKFPL